MNSYLFVLLNFGPYQEQLRQNLNCTLKKVVTFAFPVINPARLPWSTILDHWLTLAQELEFGNMVMTMVIRNSGCYCS